MNAIQSGNLRPVSYNGDRTDIDDFLRYAYETDPLTITEFDMSVTYEMGEVVEYNDTLYTPFLGEVSDIEPTDPFYGVEMWMQYDNRIRTGIELDLIQVVSDFYFDLSGNLLEIRPQRIGIGFVEDPNSEMSRDRIFGYVDWAELVDYFDNYVHVVGLNPKTNRFDNFTSFLAQRQFTGVIREVGKTYKQELAGSSVLPRVLQEKLVSSRFMVKHGLKDESVQFDTEMVSILDSAFMGTQDGTYTPYDYSFDLDKMLTVEEWTDIVSIETFDDAWDIKSTLEIILPDFGGQLVVLFEEVFNLNMQQISIEPVAIGYSNYDEELMFDDFTSFYAIKDLRAQISDAAYSRLIELAGEYERIYQGKYQVKSD